MCAMEDVELWPELLLRHSIANVRFSDVLFVVTLNEAPKISSLLSVLFVYDDIFA